MIRYANPSPRPAESAQKSAGDYTAVLTAKARRRLIERDAYLENAAPPGLFPHRSTKRDDLHPDLRITHYKSKTIIAFFVDEAKRTVLIADIFHAGRDHETALRG